MIPEKFYKPTEIASMLSIRRDTVIQLILRRDLAATMVGKQYRISEAQFQDFLRRQTIQPK